jgi:predicted DNA binding CopG/RHH family protein
MSLLQRDKKLTVMMSDRELVMIRELAEHEGLSVSDWLRQALRRAHAEAFGAPKPKRSPKGR